MFETQKIDSFFSGEKNLLDEEEEVYISKRTKVVRFLKLFLPCLTALLLGVGVALFDFDTNSDTTLALADEEKVYFEKFRMKNTVFEITEKDNQLSTLRADVVEEIEPGKKLYNLTNPSAKTLDKGKTITLTAQFGTYNQKQQILKLNKDVVTNYNKEMEAHTNSATYDFAKEYGFGNEKIIGDGERGHFEADKFTFDKKKGIGTLIKNVVIRSKDFELKSPDKATLFLNDNKFISTNATVKKGKDTLKGDTVTAFFKDTKSFDIDKAYSKGHTEIYSDGKKAFADRGEYQASTGLVKLFDNVKIVDSNGYTATADFGLYNSKKKIFTLEKNVKVKDKNGYTAVAESGVYDLNKKTFTLEKNVKIDKGTNVITAPKAIYFQSKDEFRFYDDVKVTQADNTATANSGVYFVKKNVAELEGNVVITKNGNMVKGDKAISDFTTSKSRLIAKNGGRISGKLIESTLKEKKDK